MKAKCRTAVNQVLGREINNQEAEGIEKRLLDAMRGLARQDPQGWASKSQAQRFREAAGRASVELAGEAQAKRVRVAQAAVAQARWLTILDDAKAAGKKPSDALYSELVRVDTFRKGVENTYFSQLIDAMESVKGRLFNMIEDAPVAKALVDEIFGRDSGSAIAKKGAKVWIDSAETMRVRYNASGGNMGKLDYNYLPQPHDQVRILKAGQDAWVADVLPLMDRERYYSPEGQKLNDDQMKDVLKAAWLTLSSGGANKQTPGAFKGTGAGLLSNPSSKSREIHFAGPDEYMVYRQAYGSGSIGGSMQAHIGRMARDIALAEQMGPNWNQTFAVTRDTMVKAGDSTITWVGPNRFEIGSVFKTITGANQLPAQATTASLFQGARNVEVAAKLGSTLWSSVNDLATLFTTTMYHKLPMLDMAANMVRSLGPEAAEYANRNGMVADSMKNDLNRWAEGHLAEGWTGKIANGVMKASLLNAWTDALRRGFSLTMQAAMGKLSRVDWAAMNKNDRQRLMNAGFSEADWGVIRQALPEDWRGQKMLTPDTIQAIADPGVTQAMKDRATSRLLGYILDESEYAVVNPDLATRTLQQGGMQKGSLQGELWRSAMQFKSFPNAMMTRHWRRFLSDDTMTMASRVQYGASLAVGLTALGYVSMSMNDIWKGKDPRDTSNPKTWGAAILQGGGLGIFGDFLFANRDRSDKKAWQTAAGPIIGDFTEVVGALWGGAVDLAVGSSDGDISAADERRAKGTASRLLSTAKGLVPGQSLWYVRSVIDRAVMNDLNEYLSPGYMNRMRGYAEREGSGYWWELGKMAPERLPDLGKMIGQGQ